MNFSPTDYGIFTVYLLGMMAFGLWLSRKKGGTETTQDYFLAGNSLPWWAIGASLIASNISTEQIMAMNGAGFEVGMAIATYELLAALTLIIVAKYFLPVFIKKGIYTMPQFLEKRFNGQVRSLLSVFWVALFVFVNITSVLYLGGLAIQSILGIKLIYGILLLVVYSAAFSIFGGLKAVVWTDVVQVTVLVIGGSIASILVLSAIGNGNPIDGLSELFAKAPEKFDMIFGLTDTYVDTSGATKSSYELLPGITVLFGGMWIANLYYWGSNQYIIQRALAAKNIREAQKGVAFAGFLKLLMPFIVVIPGIAGFVLAADIVKAEEVFPWVLNNYVASGLKGLVLAALVAAIGSSISSMVNSASTIFTLDIYRPLIRPDKPDAHYVRTGKIAAAAALLIGAAIAPALGSLGQVFQYIQEYTGFISPGVVAIFLFGMFWRPTTSRAALAVVILSIPISLSIKLGFPELPFLDRMGIAFLVCCTLLAAISYFENKSEAKDGKKPIGALGMLIAMTIIGGATALKFMMEGIWPVAISIMIFGILAIGGALVWAGRGKADAKAITHEAGMFKTDTFFNFATVGICLVLSLIYVFLG
ncbi:MAG: sodium/solute symporter [Bacteroidota bacterium]